MKALINKLFLDEKSTRTCITSEEQEEKIKIFKKRSKISEQNKIQRRRRRNQQRWSLISYREDVSIEDEDRNLSVQKHKDGLFQRASFRVQKLTEKNKKDTKRKLKRSESWEFVEHYFA